MTKCKRQRKLKATHIESGSPERVLRGNIACRGPMVVYEIRYSNGSFCSCGEIKDAFFRKLFTCKEQLPLDKLSLVIDVSTNKIKKDTFLTCDFNLLFGPRENPDFRMIEIVIPKEPKAIPSTHVISQQVTSYVTIASTVVRTSYVISTRWSSAVIGQLSSTLSSSSLSPSRKSTTTSSQLLSLLPTTLLPTQPVLITSSQKEVEVPRITSSAIEASPTTLISPTSTVSPETEEEKKFKKDVEFIKNFNTSNVDINDTETIGRVLDAVTNLISTNQTTAGQKQDPGEQAVEVLQDLGNSISQQLDLGNKSVVTFEKVTDELVFGVAVINVTTSSKFSFPSEEKEKMTGDEKIVIPNSVFNSNNSGKAYFVGIIFKAYREMRNNTGNEGFEMGTKVINAVVSPAPNDVLKEPVEMTFEKNIAGESLATECSFWIENSLLSGDHGRWSTRQCFRAFENKTHIKCACYHFTNFAVLFKVSDDQNISEEDTFRLVIITYVGLSLSILGCLLTFIIYVTLQNIKSDRATIHINLVLALGIADVIFLVTVALKPVKNYCLVVAMLAFYFYLAVFFWMLVEGVYIYLMVIKVFRGNVARRQVLAYLVGWGCPLPISLITYAVLTDDVVSKYYCWLSVESGAIWAFVGPGLIIILVNCVILLVVVKTTWITFSGDKEFGGLRSATKTFGAVIPILGITWLFGVMAFNESSVVFQYIFAITNSIQGALIFVLYCLVNKEVRTELLRRVAIWQTRREMTSSSGGRRHVPQVTRYSFPNPAQEMKEKQEAERSSLLDDVNQTETTTKQSETSASVDNKGGVGGADSGNCSPVENCSPVGKNAKIGQSFDSI